MLPVRRTTVIKRDSDAADAVALIKQKGEINKNSDAINMVVRKFPMERFSNPMHWFKVIFAYLYEQISFEEDELGREQIKSADRFLLKDKAGDCDCHTAFWVALLKRQKIKHIIRIIKYKENNWAHIYPIVPYYDPREKKEKLLFLDNVYAKLKGGLKLFNKEIAHRVQKDF